MEKLKKRHQRHNYMGLILIIILAVAGIGFAIIGGDALIEGDITVNKNRFAVIFENIRSTEGSITTENASAIIDKDDPTKLHIEALFNIPGEYYEVLFDVTNTGTIPAILDKISSTNEENPYLKVSYTYEDGKEIKNQDKLDAGSKKTVKLRVELLRDIDSVPPEGMKLDFTFNMHFIQDKE